MGRVIIAGPLGVRNTLSEWFAAELEAQLVPSVFSEAVVLGSPKIRRKEPHPTMRARNVVRQAGEWLELGLRDDDFLINLDMTETGGLHDVLLEKPAPRSLAFCFSSCLDRYSRFHGVRKTKWKIEKASAELYDQVLLASDYHAGKLGFPNGRSLGSLPPLPVSLCSPAGSGESREYFFCNMAAHRNQEHDQALETAVKKVAGKRVAKFRTTTRDAYWSLLGRSSYMLVSAKDAGSDQTVIDALASGTMPIAPRDFCYPEMVHKDFLYNAHSTAEERAEQIMYIVERSSEWDGAPLNSESIAAYWDNVRELCQ
jgi:hypothetical protein